MNSNITFIIFTYNEEKRIEHIIRNFKSYGEIILLDDGSTDKTKEIAEKWRAKFLLRPKLAKRFTETQEMYDFVRPHIKTKWIFWGFVDNLLPKSLLDKLVEISKQDKIKYVNIPIYSYLWGNTSKFAHKGYSPRFFMKDTVDYKENRIHGMGKFTGAKDEILTLPDKDEYAIRHYSAYNLNKFVLAHLYYAEAEAEERYKDGKKFQLWRMLGSMARYVIIFAKDGYKSGILGLFSVLSYVFFRFMTFFRLYELEHNITLDSIEENYAKSKEELLKDFN